MPSRLQVLRTSTFAIASSRPTREPRERGAERPSWISFLCVQAERRLWAGPSVRGIAALSG